MGEGGLRFARIQGANKHSMRLHINGKLSVLNGYANEFFASVLDFMNWPMDDLSPTSHPPPGFMAPPSQQNVA